MVFRLEQRTGAGSEGPVEASERILDAAYELFADRGISSTSMDQVARRAGVSRNTVYRRFASRETLVHAVVGREFERYFERFAGDVAAADTVADRVVAGFVASLRDFRGNPLIRGLLEGEEEALIGSLIGEHGSMIATVRRFVAGQLAREQAAGNVAAGVDVDLVAEMYVRTCASFLTIPTDLVDLDDPAAVADLARRFLVPMLGEPPR